LGYYSHYQDTNLFDQSGYQFLQLGVRFYDALSGRFTQKDRVRSKLGEVTYSYVLNLPTRYFDPSGRIWCERTDHFPWFKCHRGKRPDPEPQPLDILMGCFKKTLKEIIKGKGDFNNAIGSPGTLDPLNARDICGIWGVVDMFSGLPKKYQDALETCADAVRQMVDADPADRAVLCNMCCDAIYKASGKKEGAYHSCLNACKVFVK
jgi:RHS repeat-associated protein